MLDRLMRSVVVLTLALLLGPAFLTMLAEVAEAGLSGLIWGIGQTTSALGAVTAPLLVFAFVVGVLVRAMDGLGDLARLRGRERHRNADLARHARRHPVTGDSPGGHAPGRRAARRTRRRYEVE